MKKVKGHDELRFNQKFTTYRFQTVNWSLSRDGSLGHWVQNVHNVTFWAQGLRPRPGGAYALRPFFEQIR
jgi:hypothetical protein